MMACRVPVKNRSFFRRIVLPNYRSNWLTACQPHPGRAALHTLHGCMHACSTCMASTTVHQRLPPHVCFIILRMESWTMLKYTQWQWDWERQMTAMSFIAGKTCLYTCDRGHHQEVCPLGCVRRAPWIGHHITYNFVICYFVTLPLDQSKSIWSSVSCLPRYYLLKNPVGKIRSTQCFWIMSKTHIELQKKNMLVIIIRKNPLGEKSMMKHIA